MNAQEIKEFLKSLRKTDVAELVYKSEDGSVSFKKDLSQIVKREAPIVEGAVVVDNAAAVKKTLAVIKSESVGIFSMKSDEDKPSLAQVGIKVKVGQKVGQVEAMKIVKDVISKVKGEIVEALVSDGQKVEWGQELFLVDTSGK
ncbi:MAG: hypothetical protein LBC07_03610 [Elusimicrobiota bacterium]|jgi:biotin carboxyl carrier protein|nr:hypothetical protein [Elusimicrobiota bacterium]